MKKLLAIILSLTLVLSMAACSSKPAAAPSNPETKPQSSTPAKAAEDPASEAEKETYTLGLCLNALDENTTRSYNLFLEARDNYMAEHPNVEIEVIMTNAEANADKQMSDAEALIVKGCDAIRVESVDTTAGVTLCEKIEEAGIPVLEVRGVQSEKITCMAIGFDNHSMGMLYAEEFEKMLKADPEMKLNIGFLYGDPAQTNPLQRIDGANWLCEQYPDRVKLVDSKYANWKMDQAMNITEDWLQAHPEMNCIIAASDDMALGAINVLKSAGRMEDFYVAGIDGTASGRQSVADGDMTITVMMNHRAVQQMYLELLLAMARGEEVEHRINLGTSAVFAVTKDTVAEAEELAK